MSAVSGALVSAVAVGGLSAEDCFQSASSAASGRTGRCWGRGGDARSEEEPLDELRVAMKRLCYVGPEGLGDGEAREIWEQLRCALEEIFSGNASRLSFEELYRFAYTLVLHRRGEFLYSSVQKCLSDLLESRGEALAELSGDAFGEAFLRLWENHKASMGLTRDILMYLDRNFVPTRRLTPVFTMGLELFFTDVIMKPKINAALKQFLSSAINNERSGGTPKPLLYSVVSLLLELQQQTRLSVYTSEFEGPFLREAEEFHEKEASRAAAELSAPEFLHRADCLIVAEATRVERCFAKETLSQLLFLLHRQWVQKHFRSVIHNPRGGAAALIAAATPSEDALVDGEKRSSAAKGMDPVETLYRMYRLFEREEEAGEEMRKVLDESLSEEGQALLSAPRVLLSASRFTEGFVCMHRKFSRLVQEAFGGNPVMLNAVKRAFEGFFAMEPNSCALFCEHLDEVFQSPEGPQQQRRLRDVAKLFCFVTDKDEFHHLFRRKLGERLLRRASPLAAERFFVSLLTEECGAQYTAKFESMFEDLAAAEQTFAEFSALSARHTECTPEEQQPWLSASAGASRREAEAAALLLHSTSFAMQVEGEEPRAEPPKADAGGGGSGGEIVGAEVCEGASFAQEDCPLLVERRTAAAIAGGSRARGSCAAFGREEGHGGGRAEEETHEGSSAFECLALSKSIWSASLQVAEGEFLKGACGEKANEEPSAELPTCVWQLLPPTLRLQVDAFTKFYSLRQPKHVLSFSLHKGTALLCGFFPRGLTTLRCSTLQMCLLLLFNSRCHISAKAAAQLLEIPTVEAAKFLEALTEGACPMEASVVRVLKQCKTLSHEELRRAVTKRLAPYFTVSSDEFSKAISALIERDYIRESEDHPCVYMYVS